MKTLILLLAASLPSAARGVKSKKALEPDPSAIAEQRLQRMRTDLDLSDEQADKISTIMVRSEGEGVALYKKLRAVQAREDRDVRAVLNPAQKKKFDELQRRRPRFDGGAKPVAAKDAGEEEPAQAAPVEPPPERPDHPGVMIDTGDDQPKGGATAAKAKPKLKRKKRTKKAAPAPAAEGAAPAAAPSTDAPPASAPDEAK